ncbi:MAG TPA: hypothetical protein DCQ93_04555 [Bacteroidetes bacterium]|nr:hypothetical protein [Bacteroidota bacterium]
MHMILTKKHFNAAVLLAFVCILFISCGKHCGTCPSFSQKKNAQKKIMAKNEALLQQNRN